MRALLEANAKVNARDVRGATALHWARSAEAVRLLFEYRADVDARDIFGRTPLVSALEQHCATDVVNMDVLRALLDEGGADPNIGYLKCFSGIPEKHRQEYEDRKGFTPLILACLYYHESLLSEKRKHYGDHKPIFELITPSTNGVKRKVVIDVNKKSADGWTALSWITLWGYSDLTEYLCTTDCVPLPADPAIKSRGGQNCFSLALSTFNKGISKEMMAHFRTARKILRQRNLTEKQHKQEQVVVIVDDDEDEEEEEEEEDVIVIRKL
jgi:ankyrin repeat protein